MNHSVAKHPSSMQPLFLLLILLVVPVFVGATDRSLGLLHFFGQAFDEDGFSVNLNALVAVVGIVVLLFTPRLPRILVAYVMFMVTWFAASLAYGLVKEPSHYNVIYYLQTILPLFAVFAGYYAAPSARHADRIVRVMMISLVVFVAFLWIVVMTEFGFARLVYDRRAVINYLSVGIPQFRNVFPASVLIVFNLALAQYIFDESRNKLLHFATFAAVLIFLPLCWSRTALLGFSVSLVVQFGVAVVSGKSRIRDRSFVFVVICACALPIVVAKLGTTVGARADVHYAGNRADALRLELFCQGMQQAVRSPLFGDMFIPKTNVLAGGREVRVKRLFPAHNQYVDYLLRGGFPILAAFLAFLTDVFRTSWFGTRLGMARGDGTATALCAAMFSINLAIVIGANFQLYFVQLQTAVPYFFLVGVMFATAHRIGRDTAVTQQTSTLGRHPYHRAPMKRAIPNSRRRQRV